MGTLKHVDHNQRIYIQHEETNDVRVLGSKRLLSPSSWWRLQVSGDPSLKPSFYYAKTKKEVSICDSPCPHHACVHVNESIWLQGSLGNEEPRPDDKPKRPWTVQRHLLKVADGLGKIKEETMQGSLRPL